jgi:hypothetical protein
MNSSLLTIALAGSSQFEKFTRDAPQLIILQGPSFPESMNASVTTLMIRTISALTGQTREVLAETMKDSQEEYLMGQAPENLAAKLSKRESKRMDDPNPLLMKAISSSGIHNYSSIMIFPSSLFRAHPGDRRTIYADPDFSYFLNLPNPSAEDRRNAFLSFLDQRAIPLLGKARIPAFIIADKEKTSDPESMESLTSRTGGWILNPQTPAEAMYEAMRIARTLAIKLKPGRINPNLSQPMLIPVPSKSKVMETEIPIPGEMEYGVLVLGILKSSAGINITLTHGMDQIKPISNVKVSGLRQEVTLYQWKYNALNLQTHSKNAIIKNHSVLGGNFTCILLSLPETPPLIEEVPEVDKIASNGENTLPENTLPESTIVDSSAQNSLSGPDSIIKPAAAAEPEISITPEITLSSLELHPNESFNIKVLWKNNNPGDKVSSRHRVPVSLWLLSCRESIILNNPDIIAIPDEKSSINMKIGSVSSLNDKNLVIEISTEKENCTILPDRIVIPITLEIPKLQISLTKNKPVTCTNGLPGSISIEIAPLANPPSTRIMPLISSIHRGGQRISGSAISVSLPEGFPDGPLPFSSRAVMNLQVIPANGLGRDALDSDTPLTYQCLLTFRTEPPVMIVPEWLTMEVMLINESKTETSNEIKTELALDAENSLAQAGLSTESTLTRRAPEILSEESINLLNEKLSPSGDNTSDHSATASSSNDATRPSTVDPVSAMDRTGNFCGRIVTAVLAMNSAGQLVLATIVTLLTLLIIFFLFSRKPRYQPMTGMKLTLISLPHDEDDESGLSHGQVIPLEEHCQFTLGSSENCNLQLIDLHPADSEKSIKELHLIIFARKRGSALTPVLHPMSRAMINYMDTGFQNCPADIILTDGDHFQIGAYCFRFDRY